MSATAFVLAAGLGTRLRPLTTVLPKPLVPLCGTPMLAYSLASARQHGHREVIVNAHWLRETLRPWAGRHEGVEVTVVEEHPEILGTGGGLRAVRDRLAARFVVLNADVVSDVDLGALLAAVPDGGAAMALRPKEAELYGIVAADATGTVVRLTTVASAEPVGDVRSDTHFTGIHALHRDALDLIPEGFACVVRTAYKALVPQRKVASVRHEGLWLDVGDPAAYLDANLEVLRGGVTLPIDPLTRAAAGRLGERVRGELPANALGSVWIGEGASFGRGAQVAESVIGRDVRIPADTRLTRCVVWDGVAVPPGEHTDTVLFPGGRWRRGEPVPPA